jgi:DHA1 family bicyclomycin/chloramphenicol resistance-like MFS transporter
MVAWLSKPSMRDRPLPAMSDRSSVPRLPSRSFILALASIALIGPLAIHLFLPAIPSIKASLAVSDALAQLTFSISLLAMATSTLAYGSLADKHGRRPVLLSGVGLFLIGSAICVAADSIEILLVGRLVQAVGAGCGLTLVRTIARDAFGADRLVQAIAYFTMFYTLGPMLAPAIGGILIDAFGWRSIFVFALATGGLIAAATFIFIPETRAKTTANELTVGLLLGYRMLFRDLRFTSFVFQTGFSSAAFMTLAAASSPLMQELLNRPAAEYGLYFLLVPAGFFLGNLVSGRVGRRMSNEAMVLNGAILSFSTVAVQSTLLLNGLTNPLTLFIPGFFITFAQGIALPYAQSGAMATVPKLAGTAAGIGVFIQFFVGGAATQLYGILADGTPRPMIFIMVVSSVLSLGVGIVPTVLASRARRPPESASK